MHRCEKKSCRKGRFLAFATAFAALLGACQKAADVSDPPDESRASTEPACGDDAYVSTALFGSIEREIRWSAEDLRCESMLRPNKKGVRLRFTGEAAGSQLAIILALPGLQRGAAVSESPTVVTLTVEGSGRFFSTPTAEACWSDITTQEPVAGSHSRFLLSGTLYCVAPLGEINGDAAISMPEMSFRGIVDWSAE